MHGKIRSTPTPADLADSEGGVEPAAVTGDHHTLENLDLLTPALDDSHVHLDGVARLKSGTSSRNCAACTCSRSFIEEAFGRGRGAAARPDATQALKATSPRRTDVGAPRGVLLHQVPRSGRRSAVRSLRCCSRHCSILAWSPLSRYRGPPNRGTRRAGCTAAPPATRGGKTRSCGCRVPDHTGEQPGDTSITAIAAGSPPAMKSPRRSSSTRLSVTRWSTPS